ncbi:MAG: SCP2 sterol-binding domain-containing protein [Defluviitaleaceae bacterium]|nr:SCP2 sterol-binding domain-containing protein [Defluviitaleaceae bacterium]
MKILQINGNMQQNDYGLGIVEKRVEKVFTELDVHVENIDLSVVHPPYFDGDTTQGIDKIVDSIKESDGIVLASTAQLFAPSALMQNFLEYLQHPDYDQALKEKYCLLISISQHGGEKSALAYLTRVVQHLGGYAVAHIGLQAFHMENMDEVKDFIDKTAEDFYRATRSARKYIIPQDVHGKTATVLEMEVPPTSAAMIQESSTVITDPLLHTAASHLQTGRNYLTDQQEKEVDELSQLFSKKYNNGDFTVSDTDDFDFVSVPPSLSQPLIPQSAYAPVEHRAKTARQITQNLPHYFQPQLSAGLQAVIQINISGDEPFEGFLYIHSTECSYAEGQAPAPDVTIMADTAVWMDVLKNKQTAQKAFMIGGIKVRGDFVLLTKFDILFKIES